MTIFMKNKVGFLTKNLIFFILSKGIAFLAPILFIKFIALEEYGEIEFAYSIGSVLAVILMIGLNGAYPYFILKRKEKQKEQCFFLYGYMILIAFTLFSLFFYGGIITQTTYFIFLFSGIFALQRLYSSVLKSNDKGYIGVLYDGGYYFLLSFVIIVCLLIHINSYITFLRIGMEIYLGMLVLLFCYKHTQHKSAIHINKECVEILRYSVFLVLSGIIVFWLTSSSRIYIKYLMGYEQVGIYSLYFRYIGISVVIYQFCSIAFFKKLYLSNSELLDKYFIALIGIVFVTCIIFYFFYPLIAEYLLKGSKITLSVKLYMLLALQMPIWVGISLNEGILSRENLVNKMNVTLGILVLVFPFLLWIFKGLMTLELFTYLNIMLFCIGFLSQCWILKSKKIKLAKCMMYGYVSMIIASIYYFMF